DPDRGREDTTARRANSLPCREWGGTSERTRLQPRLPRRGPLWSGRKGGAAPERQGIPRVGWSSRPRGRSGGLVSEDSGPRRATRRRDGTRLRPPARPVLREIGTRGSRPESGFPSGGIPRPGWRLMVRRREGRRVEDGSERRGAARHTRGDRWEEGYAFRRNGRPVRLFTPTFRPFGISYIFDPL